MADIKTQIGQLESEIEAHEQLLSAKKEARSRSLTSKVKENLDFEADRGFWKASQRCNDCCQHVTQELNGPCSQMKLKHMVNRLESEQRNLDVAFDRLRLTAPGAVPSIFIQTADKVKEEIRNLKEIATQGLLQYEEQNSREERLAERSPDRMSQRSKVSRTRSEGADSVTSSHKSILMSRTVALQTERLIKQDQVQRQMELRRLEAEELARQQEHKIQLALEKGRREAELLKQEGREKIRQAQIAAELEEKRHQLADEVIVKEIEKTQTEIRAIDGSVAEESKTAKIDYPQLALFGNQSSRTPQVDMTDLAKIFADSLNVSRLPIPEPVLFHGDPLQYPSWKISFRTLIESRNISVRERIYYLKKYLGSPAKDAVEGVFYFENEEAYEEAWKILEERYGDSFRVTEAFRNKLGNWPKIVGKDSQGLRKFADFLRQCQMAMRCTRDLQILNDCRENQKMLLKLPDWIVQRWSRIVAASGSYYPSFEDFVAFLNKEADIACNPIASLSSLRSLQTKVETHRSNPDKKQKTGANTFSNKTSTVPKERSIKRNCVFCNKNNHTLHDCYEFKKKKPQERKTFIQKTGLCFGCLAHGHLSKNCPTKSVCKKCSGKHPTCLHGDFKALNPYQQSDEDTRGSEFKKDDSTQMTVETRISNRNIQDGGDFKSAMIVPVYLSSKNAPEREILVYALLDTQSDTTFILEDTTKRLQAGFEKTKLKLSTLTSTIEMECKKFNNLEVRGFNSDLKISLPATFSSDFIPVHRSHIPTNETARNWSHLAGLSQEMLPLQNCEVGLLIGYNCPQALAPTKFIRGDGDQPFAQQTDLGWSIVGVTSRVEADVLGISHRVMTEVPEELKLFSEDQEFPNEVQYICRANVKEEMLIPQICKILESDFSENHKEAAMSQEDIKFLKILKDGVHRDEKGYYEMPLPFREERPALPNNEVIAQKRLHQLKRRFEVDDKYYQDYKTFMENIMDHGEAEEVPLNEIDSEHVWYIPHHGVYNPKKPGKIRVVFDCSAKYKSTSLNDHLLTGPDLINPLIGVLCRFREEPIAIMGDIERMFHQFKVNIEHRDYLRFLWWKQGKLSTKPMVYRMKVHLFGATSSPGCANFGLKKIATDNQKDFPPEVSDFIINDFYVDDGLKSVKTSAEAIQLVQDACSMCAKGNLRLHKLISNSREVIDSIPPSERAKEMEHLNLNFEDLPIERVLGIEWCVESDHFQFRTKVNSNPFTRRGILSTVASIYDPLGLLAPFVLKGKQILQQMCREQLDWDEPLSDELRPKWEQWLIELPVLVNIKIDRCIKPAGFEKVTLAELHHFSDASFCGYGQCTYVRLLNDGNQVHCALLMGKARVAPLKVITIPRLELTAALVSVKISQLLRFEMRHDFVEHFWTDSQVVLGYLNNDARRFHVFVANRIQQIKDATKSHQWNYIDTGLNPADCASRGLNAQQLADSTWFKGPKFLWNKDLPPEETLDLQLATDDPEVRKVIVHAMESTGISMLQRIEKFSSWTKLVIAIAMLAKSLKVRNQTRDFGTPLLEEDRQNAEKIIIKWQQGVSFSEEITCLEQNKRLSNKHKLYKLDPFVDEEGVLRVGGRLTHSTMQDSIKYPIILPKSSHVTSLMVKHFHGKIQHQGRGMTVNEIRQSGFWIIGCSKVVSSCIFNCVTCRKLRGKTEVQKMADLPEDRLEALPPFSYCGMDCFGPFIVKEGRKEHKKYGLLITCMACRAIHVEMMDDMSTDTFINALRCFIALRGPVRQIRSDQGSNFMGAQNVLRNALQEMKEEKLRNFFAEQQCDFVTNPPASSHMGGVWERQIRTIRNVLSAILNQNKSRLDAASLRTFLYEAMAIVNSRPLTAQNLYDPTGPTPLTPNYLLTMKSTLILPPPGKFVPEDVYARKRWRKVQYLANEFWSRWRKEYLLTLQSRQKWSHHKRNLEVGDVVMLKDEDVQRTCWKLAKVIEVVADQDGLVRKVKILMGDACLSKEGKRIKEATVLERPIHKLVLLLEASQEN